MFEGLIDAIEEAILLPAAAIAAKDELTALNRCEDIFALLLQFCQASPGVTRILTGMLWPVKRIDCILRIVHFTSAWRAFLSRSCERLSWRKAWNSACRFHTLCTYGWPWWKGASRSTCAANSASRPWCSGRSLGR